MRPSIATVYLILRIANVWFVSNRVELPQNAKAKFKYPNLQAPKKIQPKSTHVWRRYAL
ncbi:hypothetical protein BN2476_230244 [Paraburkholderia piptadeniae]|uniref:Uncharacterized protein n=1 Tax=Paraburkholderia piptadeniae TaxID=1701573 RepID=A0A1N7RYQ7_9BURK|nr:hypothetical protein BN2476_230244 [Paraburkholderia piptadeniae]